MEGYDQELQYYVNSFVAQLVGRYGLGRVLSEVEHAMIKKAVGMTTTTKDAANLLKTTRTSLYYKNKLYGIKTKDSVTLSPEI